MEQDWPEFAVNWTGLDPIFQDDPIPYWGLADQGCVHSRFGMTQFPIFADFRPRTTRGTPEVFYELVG